MTLAFAELPPNLLFYRFEELPLKLTLKYKPITPHSPTQNATPFPDIGHRIIDGHFGCLLFIFLQTYV
jgi:hypothetical protein